MRPSMDERDQPIFNDIRIDLRSSRWVSNPQDQESDLTPPHRSVPSRIPRYAEYPQVHPTNPIYTPRSINLTPSSDGTTSNSRTSATLVSRRQKFDPRRPRRPSDWRGLSILSIILFFPTGIFAFAFACKAQTRFRNGFINESHGYNKRALILCIISILLGIAAIIGLLFALDAWPRTNG